MKANFVCFKLSKPIIVFTIIILVQLGFIIIGIKELRETKSFEQIKENINTISTEQHLKQEQNVTSNKEINKSEEHNENNSENNNQNAIENNIGENVGEQNTEDKETENKTSDNTNKQVEEYKNMPREVKGYKVIGKITIPKLKLDSYILKETNKKSLKVSVTKLYGPGINQVGNFCIAGHNYRNNKMFGGIKKLENGDQIILTDTYGKSITYKVYENYKTDPKNVECLNQETEGEREVTLITCTARSNKKGNSESC